MDQSLLALHALQDQSVLQRLSRQLNARVAPFRWEDRLSVHHVPLGQAVPVNHRLRQFVKQARQAGPTQSAASHALPEPAAQHQVRQFLLVHQSSFRLLEVRFAAHSALQALLAQTSTLLSQVAACTLLKAPFLSETARQARSVLPRRPQIVLKEVTQGLRELAYLSLMVTSLTPPQLLQGFVLLDISQQMEVYAHNASLVILVRVVHRLLVLLHSFA